MNSTLGQHLFQNIRKKIFSEKFKKVLFFFWKKYKKFFRLNFFHFTLGVRKCAKQLTSFGSITYQALFKNIKNLGHYFFVKL